MARCKSVSPWRLRDYFGRLSNAFGWRYVAAVILTYGCNQGMGEAFQSVARDYFLIDTLGLSAATAQQVVGFGRIPWQLKSLFGILSDLVPIDGLHRAPYMIIAGILGVVGNGMLMVMPASAASATAGLWLLLSNVNFALPDVMIDATVAERAKINPARTADMQALCWGSLFTLSIPAQLFAGWLLTVFGPRIIWGGAVIMATCVGIPAALGWLGEKRRPGRGPLTPLDPTPNRLALHCIASHRLLLSCCHLTGLDACDSYVHNANSAACGHLPV